MYILCWGSSYLTPSPACLCELDKAKGPLADGLQGFILQLILVRVCTGGSSRMLRSILMCRSSRCRDYCHGLLVRGFRCLLCG